MSMTPPTSMPPVNEHKGKRKALLIGIQYGGSLRGPHEDVRDLHRLITGPTLSYQVDDVTIMIDDEDCDPRLRPTRENIIRECKRLVEGVKAGDHLLFHYSGHSDQIDQKPDAPVKELDLKDEAMVPEDAFKDGKYIQEMMIIDDDLNSILIQPLPVGSNFVAILDTCHSGTMLDLPHVKCNSYTFNIHEGKNIKTRKARSRKSSISSQALHVTATSRSSSINEDEIKLDYPVRTASPAAELLSGSPEIMPFLSEDTCLSPMDTCLSPMDINSSHLPFSTRGLSASIVSSGEPTSPIVMRSSRRIRRSPTSLPDVAKSSPLRASSSQNDVDGPLRPSQENIPSTQKTAKKMRFEHMEKYASTLECAGNCPKTPPSAANVVAFAACGDPQVSLEASDGSSMTRMLVHILEKESHPLLKDAITEICDAVAKKNGEALEQFRGKRAQLDSQRRRQLRVGTLDFMQEPMLASLEPCHVGDQLCL
ncbi:hypothetical protein PLICRDRAFT_176715 [Plicaturopsis crispa FD-325 SS-3]|nr:hypothetical protein PLICRDRAFT_176715 [Plicaturopsis crispa FD-325 SS-3]